MRPKQDRGIDVSTRHEARCQKIYVHPSSIDALSTFAMPSEDMTYPSLSDAQKQDHPPPVDADVPFLTAFLEITPPIKQSSQVPRGREAHDDIVESRANHPYSQMAIIGRSNTRPVLL